MVTGWKRTMIELAWRIAFTVGALLVYRFGTFVPLPGLDPTALAELYRGSPNGIHRLAIFALGILPYVWAAITLQLLTQVSGRLRVLKQGGDRGRRSIDRMTRVLTVLLAAGQAAGVAVGLESLPGIVVVPPWLFTILTILTLTGGTLVLVWLSEQITLRGLGNGLVLMLLVPIVTALPNRVAEVLEAGRRGDLSSDRMTTLVLFVAGFAVFIVLMERARRFIRIDYPERRIGARTFAAQTVDLPLKLNGAGIIPVLLASGIMSALVPLLNFAVAQGASWATGIAVSLRYGRPLNLIVYALLLFGFAILYTALLFDPEEMAASMKKYGGSIATLEPGEATATYIDRVLSRIMLAGACYLVIVMVLWEMFAARFPAPLPIGAVSLLIAVCATLDLDEEVQAYMRRNREA
jgi:preprotein translocase subunit SecY